MNVLVKLEELINEGLAAHEKGDFANLSNFFDVFEVDYGSYSGNNEKWVHYIRDFIDCWIDAYNHNWQHHDPILKEGWPKIANQIILNLHQKKEFSPVVHQGKSIREF